MLGKMFVEADNDTNKHQPRQFSFPIPPSLKFTQLGHSIPSC
jgi:hypothetical protein